jgi:cation:H+ antiporter
MTGAVLLVLLGLGLLVVGGESLLRGAVGLATLLRVTPAVIGLTVVAAGTSVPELAVSGIAAFRGSNDIAVANVVGSNIFNITLIVGLCALIRPFNIVGNTLRLEFPVLMITTLGCVVLVQDFEISRWEALLFLSFYVGFTVYLVRLVRRQLTASESASIKEEVEELHSPDTRPSTWKCGLLVFVGIALLGLGAHFTVDGASQLARLWGWSERLIGLTIVSAGTSLPEVVASAVSSLRGRSDVAIGNVIGSNLFNILVILGLTGVITPLPVQGALVGSDCWWMLGTTALLIPIMFNGKRIHRWEGLLLLSVFGVYLWTLLRG